MVSCRGLEVNNLIRPIVITVNQQCPRLTDRGEIRKTLEAGGRGNLWAHTVAHLAVYPCEHLLKELSTTIRSGPVEYRCSRRCLCKIVLTFRDHRNKVLLTGSRRA